MKQLLPVLLLLPLAACTHLAEVEQGIRAHALAGGWESGQDHLLIGCSGAFNDHLENAPMLVPNSKELTIPVTQDETGNMIRSVDDKGFVVSRWPLASARWDVDAWPHLNPAGKIEMTLEGRAWIRTRDLSCD